MRHHESSTIKYHKQDIDSNVLRRKPASSLHHPTDNAFFVGRHCPLRDRANIIMQIHNILNTATSE
eukprot:scaffold68123_cov50-Cyclotella_meneghiniana.AAC.2